MRSTKLLFLTLATGLLVAASRADGLLEKIAMTVLADKFGIDTREVVVLREQTNLPVYDLAPIYEGAHYFGQRPSTVWKLRNQGMGWGQIANSVGMHPGTFNKLRKQGAFDRDRFWTRSYQDRFSVPAERVSVLHKRGGSLEDVLGAIVVGKLSNQDPRLVYDQFQTQRSWTSLTSNHNVRLEDWRRVSTPMRSRYVLPLKSIKVKAKSNNGVRDHGEGVGRGKSNVKSHESVSKKKGSGHEKIKSHAKGQGKGNAGKGKGKGKGR